MSDCGASASRTRVLVVDDRAFMRTTLTRMINCEPDLEVVASACGSCALNKINVLDPDVVTLVSVPGLDGMKTLRCILNQSARPVIVVSASIKNDTEFSLPLISAGASDYVPKPMGPACPDAKHIQPDLIGRIRAAARARLNDRPPPQSRNSSRADACQRTRVLSATPEIVAIGVSTGGPKALEQILPRFPSDFPVPILIVQHMPVGFTGPFAERLNALCPIGVRHAVEREHVQPGLAYIAPAGLHMRVFRRAADAKLILSLDPQPHGSLHIPSIDVLMESVAEVFHDRAMGVIMTGMGSDGAEGMSAIFREGGLTIGQNEATCAVFGMPRICSERGILSRLVPLSDIPTQIIQATRRRTPA